MPNAIPESELILNQDGSVYHLNLRPGQVADVVLTVGDPNRVEKVSRHFDSIELKVSKREFVTHTGTYRDKRLTVISTGIGTDNIDIVLNELDALVNIDLDSRKVKRSLKQLKIIRLGTTGGIQPDVPVDSMVAGAYGIGLDNVLQFYQRQKDETEARLERDFQEFFKFSDISIYPYAVACGSELLRVFSPHLHVGITVTSSGFYGPQGRKLRLATTMPHWMDRMEDFRFMNYKLSNFEMETSAIYGLGQLLGHECLSVNTVVANRSLQTFSKDPGKAVDSMIRHVLDIVADEL